MKKYFFFAAIILIIYIMVAGNNFADPDLWHRLAVGKLLFKTGAVPKTDIFAYTPTKELWIDHEWGSGAVFYFIVENFGGWGLSFLRIITLFLTFLPVFLLNRLKSDDSDSYKFGFYFVFIYALFAGFIDTIRSQSFTYVFFALWLYLLELIKRGHNKLLFIFPLMTVIWANMHGGFVAGLGILTIYGIGEFFNRKNPSKYFITAGISALATLINPYGFEYWKYMIDAITLERIFITEWQPLDLFGSPVFLLGFKVLLLMTIITLPYIFIKKFREINWAEIFILIVTCYLTFKHIRHNIFFVIASAAYMRHYFYSALKYYFSFLLEKIKNITEHVIFLRMNIVKDVLIYGLVILLGVLTMTFVPLKVKVNQDKFPVKSVEFIKKNELTGNLLVLFNWGSYALWKLHPQCLVAIDGRYEELYSDELVNESARFHYLGKDWEDFMKKYKADLVLIDKSYPVFGELLKLDDWKIVYQDRISAVFIPVEKTRERWIKPEGNLASEKDIFESDIAEKPE